MKTSEILLGTLKETPSDAEIVSHQLMLRAGLIRKLASGLYTWLPMGLRVLRKVEAIVREEMNRVGAQEILMPTVQPAELWHETQRWDQFGPQLLRMSDRHQRDFCLGPTHEEVVTDLFRREIRSYKALPICFYQIQTKFRDEVRPRFGVMRAREFIMKDAYSFHIDDESLQQTYQKMHQAYCNIFDRLGLDYRPVMADSGSIGGSGSHEFHVLAESGEDAIAFSDQSDYAANIEKAEAIAPKQARAKASKDLTTLDTPGQHSIDDICTFLKIEPQTTLKTLLVQANDTIESDVVALIVRGDHDLNTVKAEHLDQVASPLVMATAEQIKAAANCEAGSIGPVGLNIPVIADHAAVNSADFVCGANIDGKHLSGVNWGRDLTEAISADIRNIVAGDPSPDGKGTLQIRRGIEVGHIFQLGKKYSESMKATVLADSGKATIPTMGCYGIGISRIVAAAIEQNHDDRGIIWNHSLCPFQCVLIPINMHKSQRLREVADKLYLQLIDAGIDVLYDNRKERPGIMFADSELIGIPHRLVLGDRGLDNDVIEYKSRRDTDSQDISIQSCVDFIKQKVK